MTNRGYMEMRQKVLQNKYLLKGEKTLADVARRVAMAIGRPLDFDGPIPEDVDIRSQEQADFQDLITRMAFLPGGRVLYGAGNPDHKSSLSNCYFIPLKDDSIEGIFDCAKESARTMAVGGGVGIDLSVLRPAGSRVNNAAEKSSGVPGWMELFSLVGSTIGQHGRDGALILTLDVTHPDVEGFIEAKRNNDRITAANISVKVTDEFMQAVIDDGMIELHHPSWTNDHLHEGRLVKARDIWKKLVNSAWLYAEPGILFWDTIKKQSPTEWMDMYLEGVNPCYSGNMKLLTAEGYKYFRDIVGTTQIILNEYGTWVPAKVFSSGVKEILSVEFSNREIPPLEITPNQVVRLNDGSECEAKGLRGKKIMPYVMLAQGAHDDNTRLGFILGDGSLTKLQKPNLVGEYVGINIGVDDTDILDLFGFQAESGRRVYYTREYNDLIRERGIECCPVWERDLPGSYWGLDREQKALFLRGLYSANGSVVRKHWISYKTTSPRLKDSLLRTLREDFGIQAYAVRNKPRRIRWANGEYVGRESWSIQICRYLDLLTFAREISFVHQYKVKALVELIRHLAPHVARVRSLGMDEVYDFTIQEGDTHFGVVNGFISSNCGELPLEAYGSCNLGSLNLSYYGDEENQDKLESDVRMAVRFLNRVIDVNHHPLAEQNEASRKSRRIGLGITGLAHYLIKKGVKYGSPESLIEIGRVMDVILNAAYYESAMLAKEQGAYPHWSYPLWEAIDAPWKSHLWGDTLDAIKQYGLRNASLLTCPPVGSGSLILETSTGIEPIFALEYKRFLKERDGSSEEREHVVYDPLYFQYCIVEGKSKDLFVTAHEISAFDRIAVQSTIQQYVDSAISSTINLGPEVTEEQVGSIFIEAWRKGLKGVTIFREGGERRGVYVTNTKKAEPQPTVIHVDKAGVNTTPAPIKRPKVVNAKTVKIRTPEGSCFVNLGMVEDKPVEVFAILGKSGANEKANAEALGRLISIYLQDGGSLERVIGVLEGIRGGDVTFDQGYRIDSLPDAIAKALRIATQPPDVPQNTGKPCPSCGKGTMVRYGGCMKCDRCEYSACG